MFRRLFASRSRRQYDTGIEHFNAGRLAEAVGCFDDALLDAQDSSDPDTTLARFYRAEAHARLGRSRLEETDAAQALVHLDAALIDHPSYPDLHLQRARAQLELDDPLAAERAARSALEHNPDLVEAAVVLLVALHRQGQTGRASELGQQWKEKGQRFGHRLASCFDDPEHALGNLWEHRTAQRARSRRIEKIEGLLHEGFWVEAQGELELLLTETPDYPDLRLRLAAALAAQGELDPAKVHLDAAIARNPRFTDAQVLAGIVELQRGHLRPALDHFERAAELGHHSAPASYGAVLCELQSGHPEAARKRLEAILSDERPEAEVRFLRAGLTALSGATSEAAAQYGDAVAATDSVELLLDAAAFGIERGLWPLVRRSVDRLPPGAPDAVVARVRAEILVAEQGNVDRAIDVLEAATSTHPDNPAVLWRLAELHVERGDPEVALRRLSNLEALDAMVPGAAALSGRLLRERGALDASLEVLSSGHQGLADPALALQRLLTLRLLGEPDRALELWARWWPLMSLDLQWRMHAPGRWLGPLPAWPTRAGRSGVS